VPVAQKRLEINRTQHAEITILIFFGRDSGKEDGAFKKLRKGNIEDVQ